MIDASLLPLHDGQVRLRTLRSADAVAFAEGTGDPEVRHYAHLPEPHYTPASVRAMVDGPAHEGLARGDLAVLAIADATTDRFMGSVVIFGVTPAGAEVGFWLHPEYRGHGRTGAALGLAAELAQRSGLSHLTARTAPDNQPAQRVLAQAGFTATGRGHSVAPSGQSMDSLHYRKSFDHPPALPLVTERLLLRTHTAQDRHWLQRTYSRPEVARYLLEEPWTEADSHQQIEKRVPRTDLFGPAEALALVIEHEGAPVGDVAIWLTDREHRMAEIGWVLDPENQGQGLAAEAVRAILAVGFEHYRLHRVSAQMDARNTASADLAGAVGMRREAHLRQDWWSKGEWTDSLIYAMLPGDRN